MNKKVTDIFKLRKDREYDSRLAGLTGSYKFDVENTGTWFIKVDDGKVSVSQKDLPADCVIFCNEEDFVQIASGKQNLLTAAMQGRVNIEGDLGLAQKLHAITRSGYIDEAGKGKQI